MTITEDTGIEFLAVVVGGPFFKEVGVRTGWMLISVSLSPVGSGMVAMALAVSPVGTHWFLGDVDREKILAVGGVEVQNGEWPTFPDGLATGWSTADAVLYLGDPKPGLGGGAWNRPPEGPEDARDVLNKMKSKLGDELDFTATVHFGRVTGGRSPR